MAQAPKLIGEYLSELAEDSAKRTAFREDPEGALQQSGLSETQQQTLLSNDLNQIRDAIREEYASASVLLFPWPLQNIP